MDFPVPAPPSIMDIRGIPLDRSVFNLSIIWYVILYCSSVNVLYGEYLNKSLFSMILIS